MTTSPKVIIIGLDGATWDLIKPWADEGELPTFKKLMEEGVWGELESTVPPVTFPAWESMFTGMNPGNLGVYDFVKVDVEKNSFDINTPSSFRGLPIWKKLNEYGFKTCMVGIPTSKVEAVDGVMVGGPFSDANCVYPKEFESLLKQMDYEIYPSSLTKASGLDNVGQELINDTISSRFKLAKFLVNYEKPDFLALTIFIIDNIQHFFWGESRVYKSWKHIDKELGNFISSLNDSTVILVSDHGFTKLDKTLYISKFLEEKGLLVYKDGSNPNSNSILTQDRLIKIARALKLDHILQKIVSKEKLLALLSNFPDEEGRFGGKGLERIIDWERSKCIPLSYSIYLNCSENEKSELKHVLREELSHLDLIEGVLFKEEVYSGRYLDSAPDIILRPKEGVRILETPFKDELIESGGSRGWRGDHTPRGVFLAYGPNVKKVDTSRFNAHIYDIAPTILALFGIPVDDNMDGSVLSSVIETAGIGPKIEGNQQKERQRIRNKIAKMGDKL